MVTRPHARCNSRSTGGRNFETLGEDPYLAARMVEAEVGGIQGAGLIATVKHYVANNFERDRFINPGEDFTPEPERERVPTTIVPPERL